MGGGGGMVAAEWRGGGWHGGRQFHGGAWPAAPGMAVAGTGLLARRLLGYWPYRGAFGVGRPSASAAIPTATLLWLSVLRLLPYPGYAAAYPAYSCARPGVVPANPSTTTTTTHAAGQPVPSTSHAPDPIFYPRNGQTPAKTEADRQECNHWATTQPGAMNDASIFQRATFACMEGRGYTVG